MQMRRRSTHSGTLVPGVCWNRINIELRTRRWTFWRINQERRCWCHGAQFTAAVSSGVPMISAWRGSMRCRRRGRPGMECPPSHWGGVCGGVVPPKIFSIFGWKYGILAHFVWLKHQQKILSRQLPPPLKPPRCTTGRVSLPDIRQHARTTTTVLQRTCPAGCLSTFFDEHSLRPDWRWTGDRSRHAQSSMTAAVPTTRPSSSCRRPPSPWLVLDALRMMSSLPPRVRRCWNAVVVASLRRM